MAKWPRPTRATSIEQLENAVLPLLQGDAVRRAWMMKQAISRISGRLHSQRIMRRYTAEAYLR
jgi:hypothetical protein